MRSRKRRRAISAATGAAVLAVLTTIFVGPIGGAAAAPGATDLQLTKSDSPDPVLENGTLTYTIQVANLGTGMNQDATDVVVTDTLPGDVTFVSASSTAGTCQTAGKTVTCSLGTLVAGASATVTITTKAGKKGTLSNTASVATSVADTNPANNQDTETTTVNKPAGNPNNPGNPNKPGKKTAGCSAPTISGTAGNDVLTGTPQIDVIRAFAGNDIVSGLGGNDIICADLGADRVFGGPGSDTIIGGGGRDRLLGGTGGDLLRGKSGNDKLRGQRGNDRLNGGRGRDNCKGGAGRDVLRACRP